jgi:hypothetical protein
VENFDRWHARRISYCKEIYIYSMKNCQCEMKKMNRRGVQWNPVKKILRIPRKFYFLSGKFLKRIILMKWEKFDALFILTCYVGNFLNWVFLKWVSLYLISNLALQRKLHNKWLFLAEWDDVVGWCWRYRGGGILTYEGKSFFVLMNYGCIAN